MKTLSSLLLATAIAAFATSLAIAQNKETTIKENSGSTTVVKTDSKGTQTTIDGKTVYISGGDRHKEQVDYSKNRGGQVVSDKK